MFPTLSRLFSKQESAADTRPSAQFKMDLEERKAYRREMLYRSIRENLLGLEVIASMYRFRVVNLDERHHTFVAMIEVSNTFKARLGSKQIEFGAIEEFIRKRTLERYGVVLESIFWRVNETAASFARGTRSGDSARGRSRPAGQPPRTETPDAASSGPARLSRSDFDPVTPEERAAFQKAIRQGHRPPPLHVGDREYESEQAPLENPRSSGGTQYGQL